MTRRTFSRISLISYLTITLVSLGFAIYFLILALTSPAEGWEGLGRAIAIIFALFCGVYTVIALIPTTLKVFDLRFEKTALAVICLIFDILMSGAHLILALVLLGDGAELLALVAVFTILALSLLSLVSNILRLKAKC